MNRAEALDLLDTVYKSDTTPEEREAAYLRLRELLGLLLPQE